MEEDGKDSYAKKSYHGRPETSLPPEGLLPRSGSVDF